MSDQLYDQKSQIDEIFSSKVSTTGDMDAYSEVIPIQSSSTLLELADSLYHAMEMQYWGGSFKFTQEEFRQYVDYLVQARTAYVFGIKGEIHPKDIEYPAMFGPVLAAIGIYRDDVASVRITPAPADLIQETEQGYEQKKGAYPTPPEAYQRILDALNGLGVPMSHRLPMEKYTDTPDFFRVEVADAWLRGSSSEAPSPHVLFARTMVEMAYLESLFGSARITYASLASMKHGIHDLIMKNVEGMRVRT